MLGHLYDRALDGEQCWIRHDDGQVRLLSAHRWLGGRSDGEPFDEAVTQMCGAPTIELGCGPARLVARLIQREDPRLASIGLRSDWRVAAVPRPCSAICSTRPPQAGGTLSPEWGTGRRSCLTGIRFVGGRVIANLASL